MNDGYKSWERSKVRDEEGLPLWESMVVSHGTQGQTRELVSFDVAVAELAE